MRWIVCFLITLSAALASGSAKNYIYIYDDKGSCDHSVDQAETTFKNLLGTSYVVKRINAPQVIKGEWMQNAALLILPGGVDLLYFEKLAGAGSQKIKQFVKEGGSYLGICGGAYFGAAKVRFDEGGPLEMIEDRDLSFFGGEAVGPVLAKYDYESSSGVRAANLSFDSLKISEMKIYCNGGCYFKETPDTKATVIARYQTKEGKDNNLPAIVYINYGRGKVVLSGVHFEYDSEKLKKQYDGWFGAAWFMTGAGVRHLEAVVKQLALYETPRRALLKEITQLLLPDLNQLGNYSDYEASTSQAEDPERS